MSYEYKIGTSVGGLQDLVDDLGMQADPRHTFRPYSSVVQTGSGVAKGLGFPSATWHWDFLSLADRNILRAYITDQSTSVFIRTRKDNDAYANYECVAKWPEEEDKDSGRRVPFVIEFTHMVVQ